MKERPSCLRMGKGSSDVFYNDSMSSPFGQKEASYEHTEEEHSQQNPYWYKNNGEKITQYMYCKIQESIGDDETKGAGLSTNDPDACGIKARHKRDREIKSDEQRKPE